MWFLSLSVDVKLRFKSITKNIQGFRFPATRTLLTAAAAAAAASKLRQLKLSILVSTLHGVIPVRVLWVVLGWYRVVSSKLFLCPTLAALAATLTGSQGQVLDTDRWQSWKHKQTSNTAHMPMRVKTFLCTVMTKLYINQAPLSVWCTTVSNYKCTKHAGIAMGSNTDGSTRLWMIK